MKKEMNTLFLVLLITYILRTIYQFIDFGKHFQSDGSFVVGYEFGLVMPIFFDYSTIGVVLYLHLKEAQLKRSQERKSEREDEYLKPLKTEQKLLKSAEEMANGGKAMRDSDEHEDKNRSRPRSIYDGEDFFGPEYGAFFGKVQIQIAKTISFNSQNDNYNRDTLMTSPGICTRSDISISPTAGMTLF